MLAHLKKRQSDIIITSCNCYKKNTSKPLSWNIGLDFWGMFIGVSKANVCHTEEKHQSDIIITSCNCNNKIDLATCTCTKCSLFTNMTRNWWKHFWHLQIWIYLMWYQTGCKSQLIQLSSENSLIARSTFTANWIFAHPRSCTIWTILFACSSEKLLHQVKLHQLSFKRNNKVVGNFALCPLFICFLKVLVSEDA